MTWTARCKVDDVGPGPRPIDVLATSTSVTSNTEGKIAGVELRFQLDEDSTKVKVGDEITVSGHFEG